MKMKLKQKAKTIEGWGYLSKRVCDMFLLISVIIIEELFVSLLD